MLGAAAWYTLYQNQEQARESARQYALTIDEIAHKTPSIVSAWKPQIMKDEHGRR
ncbi:phage tail tape measure protein [Escherichia coli]|uniref:phage tail tape measure protein n=1 Tax=Escherichia coli TaxID=562 RepID=UPI0039A4517D